MTSDPSHINTFIIRILILIFDLALLAYLIKIRRIAPQHGHLIMTIDYCNVTVTMYLGRSSAVWFPYAVH